MTSGWTVWVAGLGRWSLETLAEPLLFWSCVATGGILLLTALRHLHPFVQERARIAVLLALPVAVLFAVAEGSGWIALPRQPVPLPADWLLPSGVPWTFAASPVEASGPMAVGGGATSRFSASFWIGLMVLASLSASAGMAVRWTLDRLALEKLRGRLQALNPEDLGDSAKWTHGVHREISFTRAAEDIPPMTFGSFRPVVVVPERLLADPAACRLVLRHEETHVHRRDSLFRFAEHLVALLFALHPLVHLLRSQISRYREMAVDAEVLTQTGCRPREYASILLRLSEALPAREPSLGMTGSFNHLKERINSMSTYKHDSTTLRHARRTGFALAAGTLLLTVGLVACSDLVTSPPLDVEDAPTLIEGDDVAAAFEDARANFDGRLLVYFRGEDPAVNATVEKHLFDNARYAQALGDSFASLSLPVTSPEALALMERFNVTSRVTVPLLMVVQGDRAVLMTTLSDVDSNEAGTRKLLLVTQSVNVPALASNVLR